MSFNKLLLASAIAALSTASHAMEAMDDSAMADTTGQDGLSITLATNLGMDMILHDKDGFTGRTDSGAMVIRGIALDNGTTNTNAGLRIEIDAGAATAASTQPTLQVGVFNTTTLRMNMGTLRVANSARTGTGTNGSGWGLVASSETTTLMNLGSISIAASTSPLLNIQMGNEVQGSWMRINTALTNGLSITNFSLNDADSSGAGGGAGGMAFDLSVTNRSNTATLNADVRIDATTAGLVVGLTQLGVAGAPSTGTGGMDVRMANLRLGNTAGTTYVGDIELIGLNLNGSTLTITGK